MPGRFRQVHGRTDQGHMAESLGEVPELLGYFRINLLGQRAQIVGVAQHVLEQLSIHKPVFCQLATNLRHSGLHAWVGGREKTNPRDRQRARIECRDAGYPCKGAQIGVVAFGEDCLTDPLACFVPAVHWRIKPVLASELEARIERNPAHQPAIEKRLWPAAYLPDAAARLGPVVGRPLNELAQHCPCRSRRPHSSIGVHRLGVAGPDLQVIQRGRA